jgi:hypothetical protein
MVRFRRIRLPALVRSPDLKTERKEESNKREKYGLELLLFAFLFDLSSAVTSSRV